MILVSACLAGIPCRWDGRAKPNNAVEELVRQGKAIPVCPEQLGGLTTPRKPAERKNGRVVDSDGIDVTDAFAKGAKITLDIAAKFHCVKSIMKSKSPSCGIGEIYNGEFNGDLRHGNGVTSELLMKSGIEVVTENEIPNISGEI